jgi:hypothetical protein
VYLERDSALSARVASPSAQAASALEREPAPRELLERERSFDRRLDVEHLAEVGLLADQLPGTARQLLLSRLRRLPDVDRAPALRRLVRDPRLQAQPRDLGELFDGLVAQVTPQLLDRRLRVREVPENDPDQYARLLEEPLVVGELLEELLDLPQDVGLLVAEIVKVRVQRAADELELVVRQLDSVVGHQYGPLGS